MVNIKYKPGLDGPQPSSYPAPSQQYQTKNTARVATSQVSADLVLAVVYRLDTLTMSWGPDVRKTLGGSILFFHTLTWWAPYCHPLHVLLPIPVVC